MSGGRHFKSAGSIFGNAESPKATKAPRISGSHFREEPFKEDGLDSNFSGDIGFADAGEGGKHPNHRSRRIVIAVISVLVLLTAVLGICGFVFMRSVRSVQSRANSIIAIAASAKDELSKGNFSSLPDYARQIQSAGAEIQDEVHGPLWTVAATLPVVGDDISASRDLIDALSQVSSGAMVPMADSLAQATPGKLLQNGEISVSTLRILADTLSDSAAVINQANNKVQAIGNTHIPQVNELVSVVKGGFEALDSASELASQVAPVLPQIFGANGTRNYLIAAENNAEIRACGGFIGSSGVLTVEDGKISLGEFESTQIVSDESQRSEITISDEERTLFQPEADTLNYTAGDSLFTPDFPRGAWLAGKIWSLRHNNLHIDGVIAADPVLLQGVLGVIGGVTALDGTAVDGANAAKVLLSDTYWKYPTDGPAQDAVFASVADAAFDKLLNGLGDVNIAALGDALYQGASDGHLLIWMADEDEEACVKSIGIDGALPVDSGDPQTGIFVNNYSYSKLDWYLDISTQKGQPSKNADGTVAYAMRVTLTNTMSSKDADNLPAYVRANSSRVTNPAQELLRLYLYAPMGGGISDVACSSGSTEEASHNGLQVMWQDVFLNPGESFTVTYSVTVPVEGADKDLKVRVTPTAQQVQSVTNE